MRRTLGGLALGALALGACGDRSTGIDLVVTGLDTIGADQIQVEGRVDGTVVAKSTAPEIARPLSAREDLRIVVSEALAPAQPPTLMVLRVSAIKDHAVIATVQGQGYLVPRATKEVDVSFASTVFDLAGTAVDLAAAPVDLAASPVDLASTPSDLAASPVDQASTPVDLGASD